MFNLNKWCWDIVFPFFLCLFIFIYFCNFLRSRFILLLLVLCSFGDVCIVMWIVSLWLVMNFEIVFLECKLVVPLLWLSFPEFISLPRNIFHDKVCLYLFFFWMCYSIVLMALCPMNLRDLISFWVVWVSLLAFEMWILSLLYLLEIFYYEYPKIF